MTEGSSGTNVALGNLSDGTQNDCALSVAVCLRCCFVAGLLSRWASKMETMAARRVSGGLWNERRVGRAAK
jgi:hypothetical protein